MGLGALAGCSDGSSTVEAESQNLLSGKPSSGGVFVPGSPGDIRNRPDGFGQFIIDPNQSGFASKLRLVGARWGRLVDVQDQDASTGERTMRHRDFAIDPVLATDGVDYELTQNPVTGRETLTILHESGTPSYAAALFAAEGGLVPIQDAGLSTSGLFTMVPRNAAVVLHLDDLLDHDLVNAETVRVLVGTPAQIPYEARIFPDPNHGDVNVLAGDAAPTFYSTRVIVDTTVSEIESLDSDPPLPVNTVGLPPSVNVDVANVALRIPTKTDPVVLQDEILRNPAGNGLAREGNGTIDFGSSTRDLVRLVRSGGPTDVTGDPANGFLFDGVAPRVIGEQLADITQAPISDPASADPRDFIVPELAFSSTTCALDPDAGDVLQQPGVVAEVREATTVNGMGVAMDVKVRLLVWPDAWDQGGMGGPLVWLTNGQGTAQFLAPFDAATDSGNEACFVQVFPTPGGAPDAPTQDVFTSSQFTVRFSEPVAAASVTPFDSLILTRLPSASLLTATDYVVGSIQATLAQTEFSFVPDHPLAHFGPGSSQGAFAERYYLSLASGAGGPTDLAGNAFADAFGEVTFAVDANEPTEMNGGRVSRFAAFDEDEPFGDGGFLALPEWSGQHLYDLANERIRPRPVVHYSAAADRSQGLPQQMHVFTLGVQTPLSSLGSKLQSIWRYADLGLSLTDPSDYNLDVEGLAWAPVGGLVIADAFAEFEIRLAHSRKVPDEYIDPASLFPLFPQSGMNTQFANNVFAPEQAPQEVVHPRELGYVVSPGDAFMTAGGTTLMPWPMNRTVASNDFRYYTWRDTRIRGRAGKNGGGLELWQNRTVLGLTLPPCIDTGNGCETLQLYSQNDVPSIGLPLLLEFRCYPDDQALGLNPFDISLASISSARPYFRAFTTGGVNQSGVVNTVDPDLETQANGGFNPLSTPPGAPTFGMDNSFYIGGIDLVVRVSRSISVWSPALGPVDPTSGSKILITTPSYSPALLEPAADEQPAGTEVLVAYRGATDVTAVPPASDAQSLDLYGDYYDESAVVIYPAGRRDSEYANPGIAFLADDAAWKDDPSAIDDAAYHQVRLTFVANPQTGESPTVSSFAFSWTD